MTEYRVEPVPYMQDVLGNFMPNRGAAVVQLNEWAKQGWELAAVEELTFYLRRHTRWWKKV